MQCGRCGAVFEGQYCPACGAPAPSAAGSERPGPGSPCRRCGTVFSGNFCPRCGLPLGAAYPPAAAPTTGRTILSIIWTLSIVGFLILAATGIAGLLAGPGLILPGILGIQRGTGTNGDLDVNADGWAFVPVASNATGGHDRFGGFIEMSAPTPSGTQVIGYWWQAFDVSGSDPFAGRVQLRVQASLGDTASAGSLDIFVERALALPSSGAVGTVAFGSSAAWTLTPRFNADAWITTPGRYYLILAFSTTAASPGTPTTAGFDDINLLWTTDAQLVFYAFVPSLVILFVTQDPSLYLAYYVLLVGTVLFAAGYHAVRERAAAGQALGAPLAAIGARLRTRSAWLTVAQVFLAVTFFQIALILVLEAFGALPDAPFEITQNNVWVILLELVSASVYEEFAFRLLLLGLPMAVGSVVLRILEVNRGGGVWNGATTPGRHIAGGLRYLVGGTVRRTSTKETLLAAWALLAASSAIFGLAHLPAWGWWKVFPSVVAGLGFGYLFLRHGITASILAHFVNNYAFSVVWMGIGGPAFEVLLNLTFLALAAAGSGFFIWYVLYALEHVRDLRVRLFGPPPRRAATPARPATASAGDPPAVPSPSVPPAWSSNAAGPPSPRSGVPIPRGYAPTYRPPMYGYPPVRFQCPACGWVEARYADGHFTCGRCGRTF